MSTDKNEFSEDILLKKVMKIVKVTQNFQKN